MFRQERAGVSCLGIASINRYFPIDYQAMSSTDILTMLKLHPVNALAFESAFNPREANWMDGKMEYRTMSHKAIVVFLSE
ncbi:hypothetical protein TCAL_16991 [Tigriopus californicus]|uniref:Uncharacterized protein n=1 Tax=Tigriopus californicus TaxID=6832 RepID=A0A553PGM4_TIGCA|nr:hypothetical protein TCAL_16991 [Tigriopus californicus]